MAEGRRDGSMKSNAGIVKSDDSMKSKGDDSKLKNDIKSEANTNDKNSEDSWDSYKLERLRRTAYYYYRRKDIKKALFEESRNREVVPRYVDSFGKRPDSLEYENDLIGWVDKGATSFHCSEERWKNPMEIGEKNTDDLRIGWDLILDVDCKFIEYSKIAAQVLVDALKLAGVENIGVKFSGGSGFHIGLAFEAFPKIIKGEDIKNFFPQGPRVIAAYLKELIKSRLADQILETSSLAEISEKTGKTFEKNFDPFEILNIDTVLISPRHLFRMPYSLHEKTGLASIVIKKDQIKGFHPGWAKPDRVFPRSFLPKPKKDEAKELLIRAKDWFAEHQIKLDNDKREKASNDKTGRKETILKDVSSDFYPPCIKCILNGMKQDGRKRALFVLINFFKSAGMNSDEIEKNINAWNNKNYKSLPEGYIKAQIIWHKKQKSILPPNCDKANYKEIAVCYPDALCARIKNPINYVSAKLHFSEKAYKKDGKGKFGRKKEKDENEFKIMRKFGSERDNKFKIMKRYSH
jgi:hypothetical protein